MTEQVHVSDYSEWLSITFHHSTILQVDSYLKGDCSKTLQCMRKNIKTWESNQFWLKSFSVVGVDDAKNWTQCTVSNARFSSCRHMIEYTYTSRLTSYTMNMNVIVAVQLNKIYHGPVPAVVGTAISGFSFPGIGIPLP